ncbi:MAG: hypothetical protein AAFU70_14800, partial [Planctomycetota bacterium]
AIGDLSLGFGGAETEIEAEALDFALIGTLGTEDDRLAAIAITGVDDATLGTMLGMDETGPALISLLDASEAGFADFLFGESVTFSAATGMIVVLRSADTDARFTDTNSFFGLDLASAGGGGAAAFRVLESDGAELVDVTGRIAPANRGQQSAVLAEGPQGEDFLFNLCTFGGTTCITRTIIANP